MDMMDLVKIGDLYHIVKSKKSTKAEGQLSNNNTVKVYSMGEDNPVIRIDIKQKLD